MGNFYPKLPFFLLKELMKHLLFLILISTFAQSQEIRVLLNASTDGDYLSQMMQFGMHSQASYNLDTIVGEKDLLDTPPPNGFGVFNLMFFQDSIQDTRVFSNADYIPLSSEKVYHEHWVRLWIESITNEVEIKWTIPEYGIDSLRIVDEAGGIVYDIDMLQENSLIIDLDERPVYTWNFKIQAWYDPTELSVATETPEFIEVLDNEIVSTNGSFDLEIYDLKGAKINIHSNSDRVNLEYLSDGYYILKITKDLKSHSVQFIKY